MAGLDRKVLNSRRITKRVAPSNPVFIGVSSHPLVWLPIIRGRTLTSAASRSFFSAKNTGSVWSFAGKGVHLQRKTNKTLQDNEGIFI